YRCAVNTRLISETIQLRAEFDNARDRAADVEVDAGAAQHVAAEARCRPDDSGRRWEQKPRGAVRGAFGEIATSPDFFVRLCLQAALAIADLLLELANDRARRLRFVLQAGAVRRRLVFEDRLVGR